MSVVCVQASQRAADVRAWPTGRACPLGRLREAWVVHRYGLARVGESGAAAAGAKRPALERLVRRAIALYEANAEQRPPGWPTSGAAALCVLAAQGRADWLAGDVARLLEPLRRALGFGWRATYSHVQRLADAGRLERVHDREGSVVAITRGAAAQSAPMPARSASARRADRAFGTPAQSPGSRRC